MSELLQIWNNDQLTGGKVPAPFNFPNTNSAKTIKINNQSRYWLILSQTQTGIDIDRIEPFSFLIMPYHSDMSVRVDPEDTPVSSLAADMEFVDYSTMNDVVTYSKGSTWFMGTASTVIEGNVTLGNGATLDVQIQGVPTMSLSAGTQVEIAGTPTVSLSAGTQVEIAGTPTVSLSAGTQVEIAGTPTVSLSAGTQVEIAGTPTVETKVNSSSIQDASGTIATANTAQTLVVGVPSRAYLFFQNISTADMWLDFGTALMSVGHGIYIPPNGSIVFDGSFIPNDQVNVISGTGGASFTCKYA